MLAFAGSERGAGGWSVETSMHLSSTVRTTCQPGEVDFPACSAYWSDQYAPKRASRSSPNDAGGAVTGCERPAWARSQSWVRT